MSVLKPYLIGAIVGACGTALAGYLLLPAPARGTAEVAATAQSLPAPSAQVSESRQECVVPAQANTALPCAAPLVVEKERPVQMKPAAQPAAVVATPVQLSAEHAKVLLPAHQEQGQASLPELYQQLVGEARDEPWAGALEQAIRTFLAEKNTSAEYEIMSVECRRTLCQVLAFGNLPTSGRQWNRIWQGAHEQPWHATITGASTSVSNQNQRSVIVTVLHRANK